LNISLILTGFSSYFAIFKIKLQTMKYRVNIQILAFFISIFFIDGLSSEISGQNLKQGFFKEEYAEMLRMAVASADTPWVSKKMLPKEFVLAYRSPVTGLDNRWDLWTNNQKTAAISIRGTTGAQISWLENFYAAMIPASGQLNLDNNRSFSYKLSDNPQALVHAGWLMATGFLSETILQKIDSCYKQGYHDFYITGHSQGGAISFLMTSYLLYLQKEGKLPSDIQFKTYCSAAPKPGNLYYAYDYEHLTQNGWAYNVVNSADWVPETPLSVQTISDFNPVNPFKDASSTFRKQKFPTRMVMKHAFRNLDRPARRTARNYKKYLGNYAGKMAGKIHPELQMPDYMNSSNYVRTGTTIVLYADEVYYQVFPNDSKNVFIHHMATPYMYLLGKLEE